MESSAQRSQHDGTLEIGAGYCSMTLVLSGKSGVALTLATALHDAKRSFHMPDECEATLRSLRPNSTPKLDAHERNKRTADSG